MAYVPCVNAPVHHIPKSALTNFSVWNEKSDLNCSYLKSVENDIYFCVSFKQPIRHP